MKNRSFSHLRFVDNTILFLNVEEDYVRNVKYVLRCFQIFSGLSINFNKPYLVGFGVKEEFMYQMAALCKCEIGSVPFDYL